MEQRSGKDLIKLLCGIRRSATVKEELYSQGFRPIDEDSKQELIVYENGDKRIVYDSINDKILSKGENETF